ncbi:MAG: prolyl oligopeptidase family serine peptidase [Candidatus Promineifilaceae bacterium]|nr:prolyl oligopeptidase family serine peptidase [Candidatus Promineifilaceae bacterium]
MPKKFNYPLTPEINVTEDYHGTDISDPYRWLEDEKSAETRDWITAQEQFAADFLSELPLRDAFQTRLSQLWNYPRASVPLRRGSSYFFSKNNGLQNQDVLVQQAGLDGQAQILIDPNKLSEDGTTALINQSYSSDGRFLAYGIAHHGSDWQEIHIRDIEQEHDLEEVLHWIKFAPPAWLPDNSGFYYARYPAPGEMPAAPPSTHHRVYFHRLHTPQEQDRLVYARPDEPDFAFLPEVTDDGRYLVLTVWQGTDRRSRIYIKDLQQDRDILPLIDEFDAHYRFIANHEATLYLATDLDAPNSRLIAVDLARPERDDWLEIIPEKEHVLDLCIMANNQFVTAYLQDAAHQLLLFNRDGSFDRRLSLPALGAIFDLNGRQEDQEFFFEFSSFLWPSAVFRYDFKMEALAVFHDPPIDFERSDYVTHQEFLMTSDGTRIPIFLNHKKDLAQDGANPTILYGYGGFGVNLTPWFDAHRLAWLEKGGIYAHVVLRGGMEYGQAWYEAGKLAHKQNVFDDFISAAEWLIAEGYTAPTHLSIEGHSNGGLLTAACLVQRPELFGAVHSGVPVADMLRYHRFTAGRYWTSDYGNAQESAEDFQFLLAYSPVHNTKLGTNYPPVIITTADTDDRVVPMHAFKLAAALQRDSDGSNPILLRVESKAGHGLGKPVSKKIEEWRDVYSFLWAYTA